MSVTEVRVFLFVAHYFISLFTKWVGNQATNEKWITKLGDCISFFLLSAKINCRTNKVVLFYLTGPNKFCIKEKWWINDLSDEARSLHYDSLMAQCCTALHETDLQLSESFMGTQSVPLTSLSTTFIRPTSSLGTSMCSLEMFSLCADCICQRIQGDTGRRDPNTFTSVPNELPRCCFSHYFPLVFDSCVVCSSETLQRFRSDISFPFPLLPRLLGSITTFWHSRFFFFGVWSLSENVDIWPAFRVLCMNLENTIKLD